MKVLLATLVFLAIGLVACNNDDDTTGDYTGTWIAIRIEIADCDDFTMNNTTPEQCNDQTCNRITFGADGNYTFEIELFTETGTWTSSGTTVTFCQIEDGEQICEDATGVITGGVLRLGFQEDAGCVRTYIMEREEVTTN